MTIYDHLKKDHQKVEKLLDRLVEASEEGKQSWRKIVDQIRNELIPHARAEEAVFYNAIRELEPSNKLIRHSYTEHLLAETELRSLQAMKTVNLNFTMLAKKLRDDIVHHAQDEEEKIFPLARGLLSNQDARAIGDAFVRLKPSIRSQSMVGTTFDLVANVMSRFRKAA